MKTQRLDSVCGRSMDQFLSAIKAFHNHVAPGLVLGGLMVDWARELIGPHTEADAIVETRHCLPDAVQIFTPCTIGNGWLKILDWDKFALSLYDKKTLCGYRIWLDMQKASKYPNLFNWYMRRVSKKDLPLSVLLETILDAGRTPLSYEDIQITRYHKPIKKGPIDICPHCGEAYPLHQGDLCLACRGESYYRRGKEENAATVKSYLQPDTPQQEKICKRVSK